MDLDQQDVAQLRHGDIAGLAGLLERHAVRLHHYLLRLLRDESMTEDLFQQTWLRAAERIDRYDPTRPFAPWLLTVGRNLALDRLRRRRETRLDEIDCDRLSLAAPFEVESDPLTRLTAQERSARLAAAREALSLPDREVLSLRFDEDLSLPEMEQVIGVPLSTVKARLYRALTRLRARLLEQGPQEDWT